MLLDGDVEVSVLGRLDRISRGVKNFGWKMSPGVAHRSDFEDIPREIGELACESELDDAGEVARLIE